jgi:hypothetical protein
MASELSRVKWRHAIVRQIKKMVRRHACADAAAASLRLNMMQRQRNRSIDDRHARRDVNALRVARARCAFWHLHPTHSAHAFALVTLRHELTNGYGAARLAPLANSAAAFRER